MSLTSPALAGGFFTPSATWEAPCDSGYYVNREAFKCSLSSAGINNSTPHPPQVHLSVRFIASPKEKP